MEEKRCPAEIQKNMVMADMEEAAADLMAVRAAVMAAIMAATMVMAVHAAATGVVVMAVHAAVMVAHAAAIEKASVVRAADMGAVTADVKRYRRPRV